MKQTTPVTPTWLTVKWTSMVLLMIVLFVLSLFIGSANIPAADVLAILRGAEPQSASWHFIVMESRLPAALTALLCGAALAVSGLLLQTAFRNPLAGPGIFGITNGASLGVAIVMLLGVGSLSTTSTSLSALFSSLSTVAAAFGGAMVVTLLLLLLSRWVKSPVMLLIAGIMVGYLSSSAIALLNYVATEEGVRSYMMWGLGNFGGVSLQTMPFYAFVTLLPLLAALLLIKPLNALLLGQNYAESLGISTRRLRHHLLLLTGLLCAVATAFCGPIAFIGLAVPHMARLLLHTADHRQLLPATMLMGCVVALSCHVLSVMLSPHGGAVPINVLTPLFGAPVIIYIVRRGSTPG